MREFCTKWWKRITTVDMLFIGVLTLLASLFASWLKQFPGFSLFGALGINVNFKAIASKGKKPMLASFLTSILLMCFAAGVAMLFF